MSEPRITSLLKVRKYSDANFNLWFYSYVMFQYVMRTLTSIPTILIIYADVPFSPCLIPMSHSHSNLLAPLSHTIPEFWHLIWQEKVQYIVMLNSAAEGKLKKSEIYWPEGGSREYGPFMVTLVESQVFADYTIRTMQLVVRI